MDLLRKAQKGPPKLSLCRDYRQEPEVSVLSLPRPGGTLRRGRPENRMSDAKITVPALLARKSRGPKIAVLTAYDATMARLLDEGGADILLDGDSLGMVVQGLPNTLPVTLDEICYHGRAVARATHRAHLVGDLPFMSYQSSVERALESAGPSESSDGASLA